MQWAKQCDGFPAYRDNNVLASTSALNEFGGLFAKLANA
jgi:hypothetical protein